MQNRRQKEVSKEPSADQAVGRAGTPLPVSRATPTAAGPPAGGGVTKKKPKKKK